MTANVLGVDYTIEFKKLDNVDGYCDRIAKEIAISDDYYHNKASFFLTEYGKEVLRHELVHAFLYESGLDNESWASNEEIVDWIAIQFPKIFDIFNSLEII